MHPFDGSAFLVAKLFRNFEPIFAPKNLDGRVAEATIGCWDVH
jgi:hypothetical protein